MGWMSAHMMSAPRLLALALAGVLWATPGYTLQITGLQDPESFVYDPVGNQYFISNVNGEPDGHDNNGFISKLDGQGAVVALHFIQGGMGDVILHAPKGLALVGTTLYVADLDTIRGFDTGTGRPVVAIPVASAAQGTPVSLADLTHDDQGVLYASDVAGNAIYRVDTRHDHAVTMLIRDPALAGPRGLAVHPKTGHVIAVSWDKGKILDISPQGALTVVVSNGFFSSRFHNLSGVDFDAIGNMYVSDLTGGKIWRMAPNQRFDVIAEYLPTPADISIDREKHLILVPYRYGNAAEINGLERPVGQGKQKRTLKDYGFGGMRGLDKK
jgi:hypothetical protein